jgi:hypothetical protein
MARLSPPALPQPCVRLRRERAVEKADLARIDDRFLRHIERREAELLPVLAVDLALPGELAALRGAWARFFALPALDLLCKPWPDLLSSGEKTARPS